MGIKGRIEDMGLADIIQVLHNEHKTVGIHLASERGYGGVFLLDGELVHAAYRDIIGKDALWRLLSWDDGDFEVDQDEAAPEISIDEPLESLLLDSMRQIDESGVKSVERKSYDVDTESTKFLNTLLEMGILEKKG